MDTDGHSGLSNNISKEATSNNFQAKLCYLKTDSGNFFVVHINSNKIYPGSHYQPSDFLQELGFEEYKQCSILPRNCFYKEIYRVKNDFYQNDIGHMSEVQHVHSEFDNFMREIDSIFDEIVKIKSKVYLFFKDFTPIKPISLKELEIKTPMWIDKYKSDRFKNGFGEIERIKKELKEERILLGLLTSNDSELVDAVKLAFEKIGFKVTKTQPGFTVDLIAENQELNAGLEVTGTIHIITKQTKKINQILAFQQDDTFSGYKSIIVANIKMNEDPDSRQKPFITKDALELVESLNSVFLDTYSLFKSVRAIEQGTLSKQKFIEKVKNGKGVLDLEAE